MDLTAKNVDTVIRDCLFTDEEDKSGAVLAEGIMLKAGFHPERLTSHKEDIVSMLNQLPDEFFANKGGGWSFLNSCNTRDGVQWGEHKDMDALLVLGIAIGKAEIMLPRKMWFIFPGSMPYFRVN